MATFSKSPIRTNLGARFAENGSSRNLQTNDSEIEKTLKSLSEKNYAMNMEMIDCTLGESEVNRLKTFMWNRAKSRGNNVCTFTFARKKHGFNEFFMTFDLKDVAQLIEFQITISHYKGDYDHNKEQFLVPQMVIIEGKKDEPFEK
jgi:hypothetical protein